MKSGQSPPFQSLALSLYRCAIWVQGQSSRRIHIQAASLTVGRACTSGEGGSSLRHTLDITEPMSQPVGRRLILWIYLI